MQFPPLLVFSTSKMVPCPEFVAQTSDDQEALNSFLIIPESGIILVSLRKPETKKIPPFEAGFSGKQTN